MSKKLKPLLHRLFEVSIIIKGIDGFIDLLVSVFLFFATSNTVSKIIPYLYRKELIEDPNDFIANYLLQLTQGFLSDTQLFIAIYLCIHGTIKISLALAFKSNNYFAYRSAEVVLTFFTIYQLYRFSNTHSILLLLVTLVDILTIIFVHKESKKLNKDNTSTK